MTHPGVARTITVGVADKQHAALAFAADEARLSGCDVRVVHAYTVPPTPPDTLGLAYGIDLPGAFRESGREILADATEFLRARCPELHVRTLLEEGAASRVLTATSDTSRLVVLGPDDDIPWYSRLFVSRVSRRLTEKAGCPVVVVPDTWSSGQPDRGVTLLLDSETAAHGPLRFGFEHAVRHGDALHILHIRVPGAAESVSWHDMSRLIGKWRAIYPNVWVDTRVVDGTPDLATVETFERTGLLVLGRSHEHHKLAAIRNSLARSVIEHADCPVAVVPADYEGLGQASSVSAANARR